MMRTLGVAFGLAAFGLTAFVASAMAAELPVKAPPPPLPPPYTWTGVYLGAHLGGGVADNNGDIDAISRFKDGQPLFNNFHHELNGSSFIGGGQLGANYQFDENWVIGVEGDITATRIQAVKSLNRIDLLDVRDFNLVVNRDVDWLASVRGRIGYAWDRWLVYATGGGAWARIKVDESLFNPTVVVFSERESRSRSGWVAGGGFEYAFAGYGWGVRQTAPGGPWGGGNWIVRAEFLHYQLGRFDQDFDFAFPVSPTPNFTARHRLDDLEVNVGRVGLSYKFAPPPPAVTARY
jgi:outer membrane immunogenic protein